MFGKDFIGPFFHNLFPDVAFDVNKMSFPAVCTILSIMRLAYPQFRDMLKETVQNSSVLQPRCVILVKNLWYLFEFFIPVVFD